MMSLRQIVIPVVVMLSCAVAIGLLIQRQLEATWFGFGAYGRVIEALERSLDDQKELAAVEPERATEYRARFEGLRETLNGLRVLEHNRDRLLGRARLALFALLAAVVGAGAVASVAISRRDQRRLGRLRTALKRLSAGEEVGVLEVRGGDAIGRVAEMVEETSRLVGGQRRRLEGARRLTAWQEAARRQVHEIRGPVTSAQLQLRRLRTLVNLEDATVVEALSGLEAELEMLALWTRSSAKFGRLPLPKPERVDLRNEVQQFAASFADAWPGLDVNVETSSEPPIPVAVDRPMLRQVLVNLAENSAQAIASAGGSLVLYVRRDGESAVVEAEDDGPGIDPSVADRLFDPHVTTRALGEGSGLGLAISRKIALDHGGDLETVDSDCGARFRLRLPIADDEVRSA
jgi:signal transduction histidine kinase